MKLVSISESGFILNVECMGVNGFQKNLAEKDLLFSL